MLESLPNYDLIAPARILFGWGRRRECGPLVKSLGNRATVVCGSRSLAHSGRLDEIVQLLQESGVTIVHQASIHREPETADVDELVSQMRKLGMKTGEDVVLAIGGGATIDLAKAAAALVPNDPTLSVKDYLEGVGRGAKLLVPPLPMIALPTTSGTGSEATKNAVISSFDPRFKKSLRSDLMMPKAVLVDPELTVTVPPQVTAQTGMDALTQLIESYISRRTKPLPQTLALFGLRGAADALRTAYRDGSSRPARVVMSQAALISGICLANSGLGMAHGVAAALGVHCRVPHGLACALMLPVALRVNRDVKQHEYVDIVEAMTGMHWLDPSDAVETLLALIEDLCEELHIPRRLSQVGVTREQLPALVRDSRGNSMDGNPKSLDDEELMLCLEGVF